MNSANETDCEENVEIGRGNGELVLAAADDLISSNNEFILSASGNKGLDVDKEANKYDLCCKDEVIARLETELRNVQDKLCLKNERCDNLKEAYDKLRRELHTSELEWEKERLTMYRKITSLQSSLNSQIRISDCLQAKLKMCDQALAHEESRRKLVEVQLCESRELFENIYAKFQEEQAKIDKVNAQKDDEIASLKYSLAIKDVIFKEVEYKNLELKRVNENMDHSRKEFQEAKIKHTEIQKKFEKLEKVHGSCSANLELKEMEWSSQLDKSKAEAKEYLTMLNNKETEMFGLRQELEMCQFSLHCLKEEMDVFVMVLKSEYSEACSKLLGEYDKNQNQIFMLETDLEGSKNMLEETQRKQRQLTEYVQEVENGNRDEMAQKTHQIKSIDAEMQRWKSYAAMLKEETQEIHKQMEIRLQLQLQSEQACKQELEGYNDVLEQQVSALKSALVVKDDALEVLELKNKSNLYIIEELESKNISVTEKISRLEIDYQNVIDEMEQASNKLHEICCHDEMLLAAFTVSEYASFKEQKLCNEISSHDLINEAISFSPASTKLQSNERLPFQEINY